jgi:hypothetical protein
MSRCDHGSFYLAGVKIGSGEAVALTPSGPLRVVCRTAGPGQINVQELADGTPVQVPRIGVLAFDANAWQGKKGRRVDVAARAATLKPAVAAAYFQRVAASRNDLESVMAVLNAPMNLPTRTIIAMLRRNKQHWGAIFDVAVQPQSDANLCLHLSFAIAAIDDPVLLAHAARRIPQDRGEALVPVAAMKQLVHKGFAKDVASLLVAHMSAPHNSNSYFGFYDEVLTALPKDIFISVGRTLLDEAPSYAAVVALTQSALMHGSLREERDSTQHLDRVNEAGELLAEADTSDWPEKAVEALQRGIEQLENIRPHLERQHQQQHSTSPYSQIKQPSRDLAALSDEDLIEEFLVESKEVFSDTAPLALELVKRPLPNHPVLKHPDVIWMRVMRATGVATDEELATSAFWYPDIRRKAILAAPLRDVETIAAHAASTATTVMATALARIGDTKRWAEWLATKDDLERRTVLERLPAETLTELVASLGDQLELREAATYRGLLAPDVAITSMHAPVRKAAVMRSRDPHIWQAGLNDPSMSVQRAAVWRSQDIEAIKAVRDRLEAAELDDDADAKHLLAEASRRVQQLSLYDLVLVSMQRNEIEVARAALASLNARDLLSGLITIPELLPYVAQRLEHLTKRPHRFRQ